jgi:hypothetical protein
MKRGRWRASTDRADAAHRVGLAGGGVPGTELNQPLDRGLDPVGVYLAQQCPQVRVGFLPGERGAGTGLGRAGDEGCRDRGDGGGRQERAAGSALAGENIIVLWHAQN